MSLASLGLRLAILNAFAPEGATVWPTLAGDAYHDSLLDPLSIREMHPQVVFMVDEVNGEAPGGQNGGRRLQPRATLTFILTIYVKAENEAGQAGFVAVETDHEAADMLDILSDQIRLVLLNDPAVNAFAPRLFTSFHTENFEDEAGVKYARRALTIGCTLLEDAHPALASLVAALPAGERKTRGQAALNALAQTRAIVEGNPPPLVVENSILAVRRQDGTVPPEGDTTNQIEFSPIPAS